MIEERRKPTWEPGLPKRATLVWALVAAVLLLANWANIAARRFPDPDDILRLVQVRDLLGGQSWYDLTQYRIDAPNGGVPMHWSRLVDIPLLLIIGALSPLFGQGTAEIIALVTVPLVSLFCAILLGVRLAWRLIDLEAATLAGLVMALSAPLLFQFGPLRIDHHGWQIVCALAAANALAARDPARGGIVLGLALACWLAISVEGLPMALAFCGIAALRWLRDRTDRLLLVRGLQVLAFASLAIFAATRGPADLAAHCDTLSPPFLGMICWGALGVTVLERQPLSLAGLTGGFSVIAAGVGAIAMLGAPDCLAGGFAATDPMVRDVWLARVPEGLPVWKQDIATVLQSVILPVFGLFAAVALAARSNDWLRRFWFDYLLLIIAALAVSVMVNRASAVAAALAAVPLGWQLQRWLAAVRGPSPISRRLVGAVAIALAFVPTLPLAVIAQVSSVKAAESAPRMGPAGSRASGCDIAAAAPMIARLPKGEIAAPLDIGPALLMESQHNVIASGHHRGSAGIRFIFELFAASPEDAHARLLERETAYVAICRDLMEVQIHAGRTPGGLADHILKGKVPHWMDRIDTGESGLEIWAIRPA